MNLTSREFTRTLQVQSPLEIDIVARSGSIRLQGEERPDVFIRCRLQGLASADELEGLGQAAAAEIRLEGGRLEVREPIFDAPLPRLPFLDLELPGRFKVDYELRVPRSVAVSIESGNGSITVWDVAGPASLRSHNGSIEARGCRAALEASSRNGAVIVEGAAGPASVSTTNGPLRLRDLGAGARASTANGPLTYRGSVAGDIDFSTNNGPIELRLPRDSRFQLDAESERGPVSSDLVVNDTPAAGDRQGPLVRLRSRNGLIHIGHL